MPLVQSKLVADDPAAPVGGRPDLDPAAMSTGGAPEARVASIREMARRGDVDALAQHLASERDPAAREALLTGLARLGGAEAARPLISALRGDDAALRNGAIEALQSMGESILGEIETLLRDRDVDVRIYAVNVLQGLRSPHMSEIARRRLAVDADVNVCAALVELLAQVGGPDTADDLQSVIDRFPEAPFLAFAARAALQRIG